MTNLITMYSSKMFHQPGNELVAINEIQKALSFLPFLLLLQLELNFFFFQTFGVKKYNQYCFLFFASILNLSRRV